MNELVLVTTTSIARFLASALPHLSPEWWEKHVVQRLSFQQQRAAEELGFDRLEQLDLASLLRVLDQNWYELGNQARFPREARSWIKELQTARNKWAHSSAQSIPPAETYRDADTVARLLAALESDPSALDAVKAVRENALAAMASDSGRKDHNAAEMTAVEQRIEDFQETKPLQSNDAANSLFKLGDLVALRADPSILLPVMEVLPSGPECRYVVFQNNTKAVYYERQLQAVAPKTDERTLLTARELRSHLTSLQILSPSTTNLYSLRLGRVRFVPYQYRPVMKLIRGDRPRLLIADEVGVGKTIEAGLIIKELRARMELASVLVICPKALVAERKWLTEMKRFDETFTALDGSLLRHCLRETHLEGEWPEQYAKAIVPFSLFDSDLLFGPAGRKGKDVGLLSLDPPAKFDLVIVDEAHHIRNSETFLHQAVRYFCDNAEAVVFLTATPVQLGSDDLFTLLSVLRPDLVVDRASFEQMAEPNRYINEAVKHCRLGLPGWQNEARACLSGVAETEWGRLFVREAPAFQGVYDRLQDSRLDNSDRVGLIRTIEEMYTFSSLINRTRRRDIGEFTTRKPETISIEFTVAQKRLHDKLLDLIGRILAYCHGQQNVKFMMTTIRRQAASCLYGLAPLLSDLLNRKLDGLELMEASDSESEVDFSAIDQFKADVTTLLGEARDLDQHDPKVDAFAKLLVDKNKRPNNKALVFSTFRHTLSYLETHARQTGLRIGVIHGEVPDDARADLRRRFALPKGDQDAIDVLLSSEVGCEGLDFQFCDLVVNYDFPWNPMRIEQRIGRIDRYGQLSETVAIVTFITPGTVDAEIYERCLLRIGVFQHAVGGSEEILGSITQAVHDIAENFNLSDQEQRERLQQLSDNGIRQIREEQDLEARQSELFGLNIPNQGWLDEIRAAETFWLSPAALQACVMTYLAASLGSDGDHILGEKTLKTLRLSQGARNLLLNDFKQLPRSTEPMAREWEKWLKGSQPTLSISFDHDAAAENPRTVHLTVLHPLVRQAARHQEINGPKYVSLSVQSGDIAPGTHFFALYRWTKRGIKPDEMLMPVSEDRELETRLLSLLESAEAAGSIVPSPQECDALDALHHQRWTAARAEHISQNHELIEHRIQSLTVSHRARAKVVEEQMARATSDKIRLMKRSEVERANVEFTRRLSDLQSAANSGDIQQTPVLFGAFSVTK